MTLDRCCELLKEIRALERTRAALALHATNPDWCFTLQMIADRVFWLRGALQVEDPHLIGDAMDRLDDELRREPPEPVRSDSHTVPCGSHRIH